jgi:enterochelin esterase-like enzyme
VVLFFPAFPFEAGDAGLLVLNDGQDVEALRVATGLDQGWVAGTLRPLVVLAVPAGDRLQEYGTAADGGSIACLPSASEGPYGTRAAAYEAWVVDQLLPDAWARLGARPPPARTGFLGASLGGLSAFSTAWGHPGLFGYAGALSGSFWWRTNPGTVQERQDSRIMRTIVARSAPRPGFRAWLEAGTADETADRNADGVIDAIEDTQDLILALADAGVSDVVYREVPGGQHGYPTWSAVLPEFLRWAAPP